MSRDCSSLAAWAFGVPLFLYCIYSTILDTHEAALWAGGLSALLFIGISANLCYRLGRSFHTIEVDDQRVTLHFHKKPTEHYRHWAYIVYLQPSGRRNGRGSSIMASLTIFSRGKGGLFVRDAEVACYLVGLADGKSLRQALWAGYQPTDDGRHPRWPSVISAAPVKIFGG